MSPNLATTVDETPIFFESGPDTLFGIVTAPTGTRRDVGVVLMYGGGYNMSANLDQFWTHVARRLAAEGFHVLRFDHHGNGDSTGTVDNFDHRYPFSDDLEAAVDQLAALGLDQIVLLGDCLGARACFVCAAGHEAVVGVYALSTVVNDEAMDRASEWASTYGLSHYVRRALSPRTLKKLRDPVLRKAYFKVGVAKARSVVGLAREPKPVTFSVDPDDRQAVAPSEGFLRPVSDALERGVVMNFVFGEADDERRARFEDARAGVLGEILDRAPAKVEISVIPGALAILPDTDTQDAVVEHVAHWAAERFPGVPHAT